MLSHRKNRLDTFQNCYALKVKRKMAFFYDEVFLYNDTDRNIMNAILDSPFTSEEIVKGTSVLKSKKVSGHDSIKNNMIKASFPSSSSFLFILFNKILRT